MMEKPQAGKHSSDSESLSVQSEKTTTTKASRRNNRKREEDFAHEFSKFKDEIKSMITSLISTQEQEILKYNENIKEIRQASINIENSIAFLTAQNTEFKCKIELLEEKIMEDRDIITILQDKIENIQTESRKSNFEIKNVPRKTDETKDELIEMVTNLSSVVGYQIKRENINDIYRVRAKKEGVLNTPIIVEMSSTLLKNDFIKQCKIFNIKHKTKLCAKHLGFRTDEYDTPIFISEHLTAKASRLHFLARDLVKSKTYKYCWTAYGRVYLRKEDNSPIIHVMSEEQIVNLKNQKDSPRELRNRAEKQRRDKLNQSIALLASLVPPVVAMGRKIDKTTIMKLTAHYLRSHQYVFGDSINNGRYFKLESTNALLSLLKGFVLTVTYRGLIVVVSHNIRQLLGYSELDLIGTNVYSIIHEQDHDTFREHMFPRSVILGKHGELLIPDEPGGADEVALALARERKTFVVRFKKLTHRSEPPKYMMCHVEGSFRKADKACRILNRCCQLVRRARARGENPRSSGNDVVFVGVVRPLADTFMSESVMESFRMEYRTRHSVDGEIIQCEQRIALVTGYMTSEVNGVNAMNFMHRDDVRWVIVALRENTFMSESVMESFRMEYRTRHSVDGEIIQCEQRIALVTGYMTSEVNGVNAMNFMHRDDVRWVIVALRENTFMSESVMESFRMEYRTRHSVDGEIIQCEQRIALVTGYMTSEVNGVNAMNFMHRDDVRWVIVALREMYDQHRLFGESCYRLMTKNGEFVYMRSRGRLDVDESSNIVTSFVCTNTVVGEEEGKHFIDQMKKRFNILVNNVANSIFARDENEPRDDSCIPVEDPVQLEKVILYLVTNLPSPEAAGDDTFGLGYQRISIIPPKKERIVNAIKRIENVLHPRIIAKMEANRAQNNNKKETMDEEEWQKPSSSSHQEVTSTDTAMDVGESSNQLMVAPPPQMVAPTPQMVTPTPQTVAPTPQMEAPTQMMETPSPRVYGMPQSSLEAMAMLTDQDVNISSAINYNEDDSVFPEFTYIDAPITSQRLRSYPAGTINRNGLGLTEWGSYMQANDYSSSYGMCTAGDYYIEELDIDRITPSLVAVETKTSNSTESVISSYYDSLYSNATDRSFADMMHTQCEPSSSSTQANEPQPSGSGVKRPREDDTDDDYELNLDIDFNVPNRGPPYKTYKGKGRGKHSQ